MAKKLHNEIGLAQNFLANPNLVRSMVSASSISGTDIVYEIGPGHGIITAELAGTARRIMAVEIDPLLVRELRKHFLHVRRRRPPLISKQDLSLYRNFVHCGFGRWRRNLKSSFKPVFSYEQWKRLSRDLRFRPGAAPSELTFEQWLGPFDFFRQTIVRR